MLISKDSERFWKKVNRKGEDDCWEWTGTVAGGYGRFWYNHTMVLAHRFAYDDVIEKIPDNLLVRHRCSTKTCCNPSHLLVGTHTDNLIDAYRRGERGAPSPHYKKFYIGELDLIISLKQNGIPASTIAKMFLSSPHTIAAIIKYPNTHYKHSKGDSTCL